MYKMDTWVHQDVCKSFQNQQLLQALESFHECMDLFHLLLNQDKINEESGEFRQTPRVCSKSLGRVWWDELMSVKKPAVIDTLEKLLIPVYLQKYMIQELNKSDCSTRLTGTHK